MGDNQPSLETQIQKLLEHISRWMKAEYVGIQEHHSIAKRLAVQFNFTTGAPSPNPTSVSKVSQEVLKSGDWLEIEGQFLTLNPDEPFYRAAYGVPLSVFQRQLSLLSFCGTLTFFRSSPFVEKLNEADRFLLDQATHYLEMLIERKYSELLIQEHQLRMLTTSKWTALGDMAGGIAHEVNNPLATILGSIHMLKQIKNPDPEKLAKILDRVERNAERIAKIIKALRSFAREGDADPLKETTLQSCLDMALDLCKERYSNHGIEIKNLLPSEPISLHGRQIQMAQVFLSLLQNAHDAIETPSHSEDAPPSATAEFPEKWIQIEVAQEASLLRIKITDSRPARDKEISDTLANPLVPSDVLVKNLGLTVAKGIIEMHNGHLHFLSEEKFCTFVISLPKSQSLLKPEERVA